MEGKNDHCECLPSASHCAERFAFIIYNPPGNPARQSGFLPAELKVIQQGLLRCPEASKQQQELCAFQESEAVTTPSPSTGPWKALGHQNPGILQVLKPALCTYMATAGALGIPGGVPRSPGHQEPHPQQALSVGTIMEYKYLSSLQKKATPYCSPRIPTSRGCPLPLPKLNLKPAGKVAAGVRGAPPGVQNEGGETGGEHIPLSRNYVPFQKKKQGHLEANQLSRSHTAG